MGSIPGGIAVRPHNPFAVAERRVIPHFAGQPLQKDTVEIGDKTRTAEEIEASRRQFLEEARLTEELLKIEPDALGERVYPDLRVKHWWFWKNQMDHIIGGLMKPFAKLGSGESANSVQRIVKWAKSHVDPAYVEQAIAESPFFAQMNQAFKTFGENPTVTQEMVCTKVEAIQAGKEQAEPGDLEALRMLEAVFPAMAQLADNPGELTRKDFDTFRQQIQRRIPFLFDRFAQDAELYVQDSLYRVGAADTPAEPERGVLGKLSDHLNEYESWRKMSRWAQKNQVSDLQFLPPFSFIGATYGQLVLATAPETSKIHKDFEWGNVFKQMVELDGFYEGIGYFIAKLQLLLVRWKEEKPDKQRARWEKRVLELGADHAKLKEQLEPFHVRFRELTEQLDKVKDDPSKAAEKREVERKLHALEEDMRPLGAQVKKVVDEVNGYKLELAKMAGLKPMGFFERLRKKPPKVLNDTLLMTGISLPLTLSYEYFFFNNQAGSDMSLGFFSMEMMQLLALFTTLGVFSNILYKGVIHTTQDRKRLYQLGEKDQLMAEKTREILFNLKGAMEELKAAEDPEARRLGDMLEKFYERVALPLIGTEADQAVTQKKLTREEKLAFSMAETKHFDEWVKKAEASYSEASGWDESSARRKFRRVMKSMRKTMDRVSYASIGQAKFELDLVNAQYTRSAEIFEKHVPEELRKAFRETHTKAVDFLNQLVQKYPYGELRAEPLMMESNKHYGEMKGLFESALAEVERLSGEMETEGFQQMPKALRTRYSKVLKQLNKGFKRDLFFLEAKDKPAALKELEELAAQERYPIPLELEMRLRRAEMNGDTLGWLAARMEVAGHDATNTVKNMPLILKQWGKRITNQDKYNPWFTGLYFIPMLSLTNVMGRLGMFSILDPAFLQQPTGVLARFFGNVWLKQHMLIRTIGFFQEKVLVLRHLQHDQKLAIQRQMEKGGPKLYLENQIREAKMRKKMA